MASSMNERQHRISLLVRENRGRAARPDFIRRLSAALGRVFEETALSDFETTNELRKVTGKGYKSARNASEPGFAQYFSRADGERVFSLVACFGTKIKGAAAFALFNQSELCGAVAIEATEALANIRRLIDVEGDGPFLITADRRNGLLLDFNPDDEAAYYELVIWGESWPILFLACLSS